MVEKMNNCLIRCVHGEFFDSVYNSRFSLFLGAFVKLRKAIVSVVMFVRPFVRLSFRMENSAPTGRIFMKFDILEFFEICPEISGLIKI
jgi:hypothetical protein